MSARLAISAVREIRAIGKLAVLAGVAMAGLTSSVHAAAPSGDQKPAAAKLPSAGGATEQQPIDVGSRKQLLIDRRLLASSKNIALRMNPPAKMGPVLLPDKPWESLGIGFCVSVLEDGGQYKMWYLAENKTSSLRYCYCYARSQDGVTWEKPNLGLIEYQGSKQNNIALTGVVETTVFLDPVAPAEARFKTVSAMHWPDPKEAGLYVHTSPDGIHWKMSDTRVLPLLPDTANQAFYDARLKKYVANIRVWAPMRKVGRVEMDDITKPWPFDKTVKPYYIWGEDKIAVPSHEVPIVFGYDERDPVPSDHYNAACVQYPWADQAYFLFPSAYRHFPEPPIGKYGNDGLVDIQMATSCDGIKWARPSREPYVALGTQDEVDCGSLYMAVGMLRRGGKIFQYYNGYQVSHGTPENLESRIGSICRLQQRLDGFVSADAAFEGGEFTTPPLVFSGSRLVLNVNLSALGVCKVEILDRQGHALPGFALAQSDEIGGNHVEKTVSWKGKSDLGSLRGRAIRLRVVLRAGKLFAFQFP
jgi:hypothetical protein